MATPSIVLVPDRYKSGVLYSQLPESGDGDLTVTRGTTATRVNASGLIESVASGVPRLDYTGGGCPSLLVEPAATNLLLRSEEFDDAAWTKTLLTVGANLAVSPDGFTNADKLQEIEGVGGNKQISQDFSQTAGAKSFSVFVKKAERSEFYIVTSGGGLAGDVTGFNLITESVTTGSGEIVSYGNDWYRCTQFFTTTDGTNVTIRIRLLQNGGSSYTGQGGFGLFVWGAQAETGSVATSYIPTVASTVTRNADVITKTGVSGFIGQTEGTLYAEVGATNFVDGSSIFTISDGTANNRIALQKQSSSRLRAIVTTASGTVADISTVSGQVTGTYKIAFAYAANDFVLYVNGTQIGTDTSGAVPATSKVNLGSSSTDTTQLNDRISAAAIYKTRLSNTELASLTTL